MVGQALAQLCPTIPPVPVANQMILYSGNNWTSYSLNNTFATSIPTFGCNTVLCPGEANANMIVSSSITLPTGATKISWKANTNSSCDQVSAVVYTSGFSPQTTATATSSPANCSATSLSGSFNLSGDFLFGFSINSTATSCVNVSSVLVWYTTCNATTIQLVQYLGGIDGVVANGTCVPNASNAFQLQATCVETTFVSQSSCTCNPGYMNVMNTSCQSIPVTSSMTSPPLPSPSSTPVPSSSSPLSPSPIVSSSSKLITTYFPTPTPSQIPVAPKSSPSSSILPPTSSVSSLPPTSSVSSLPPDTTTSFPLAIAIGAAVGGGVLAILILLIIIVVVCVCRIQVNRQGFYETNEDKVTEPTMLRYSASLRSLTSQTVVPIDGRAAAKENEFYV
eukprot:Em0008g337a